MSSFMANLVKFKSYAYESSVSIRNTPPKKCFRRDNKLDTTKYKRVKGFTMSTSNTVRPLLICGPSGSGKSTLVKRMLEEFPDKFEFSVSHTTRKPRPGEEHGKHYHFIDAEKMREAIEKGQFLEHAVFSGNYYGTSKADVEEISKKGKICVLDIDVQGVKQIRNTDLNPWSVFIKPPSLESLKQRLIDRKTETEESLSKRLNRAEEEIEYGTTTGNFDVVIINDDLDRAYNELKTFVIDNVLENKVT